MGSRVSATAHTLLTTDWQVLEHQKDSDQNQGAQHPIHNTRTYSSPVSAPAKHNNRLEQQQQPYSTVATTDQLDETATTEHSTVGLTSEQKAILQTQG